MGGIRHVAWESDNRRQTRQFSSGRLQGVCPAGVDDQIPPLARQSICQGKAQPA